MYIIKSFRQKYNMEYKQYNGVKHDHKICMYIYVYIYGKINTPLKASPVKLYYHNYNTAGVDAQSPQSRFLQVIRLESLLCDQHNCDSLKTRTCQSSGHYLSERIWQQDMKGQQV